MNNKERYFNGWVGLFGSGFARKTDKTFRKEFKEVISKNYDVLKGMSDCKKLAMLNGIFRINNYRKQKYYDMVERFVSNFDSIPDLPAGISFIDRIVDDIKLSKEGKEMGRGVIKVLNTKNTPHKPDTLATIINKIPYLSWREDHSKLWNDTVEWFVREMWEDVSERDHISQLEYVKTHVKIDTELKREIVDRFVNELKYINDIKQHLSDDFNPYVKDVFGNNNELTTHQRIVGLYSKKGSMLDLSGTGQGKTVASLVSVSLNNTRRNLIICPASLVHEKQWRNDIRSMFKDCYISQNKEVLGVGFEFPRNKRCFHIVSYQMISGSSGKDILNKLKDEIDFVILDEGHRTKQKSEDNMDSICRNRIERMMKNVRLHRKLNMLMITATPLINTVYETKSLLQLATGQLFKEITNRNTLANLSTMHCNLLENSIRFKANYDVSKIISDIECKIRLKLSPYRTVLNDVGHLGMDQIALSEAKLPKIIEYIKYVLPKDEKVILFTKYVTGMVDIIAEQLSKNGISYTYYTGSLKQGLRNKEFEGNQQVLIASSAISEGIDRLQHICNNLWIVGYPWTDSEREQVIGRVYRKGQRKNVSILNFLANINGYDYDRRIKLDRLDRKKTFSTTILEGVFPNKNIKRAKSDFNRAVDSMIKGESVEDSDILNTSLIKIRGKRRKK